MDKSQLPDLLREKRGIFNGPRFFSRSPFRSGHFLFASATNLACLVAEAALVYRHWRNLSATAAWLLATLTLLVVISWFGVRQRIGRLRTLYTEGVISNVEAGSPMDIALGVAIGAVFDWLAGISCAVLITLLFIALNPSYLSSR